MGGVFSGPLPVWWLWLRVERPSRPRLRAGWPHPRASRSTPQGRSNLAGDGVSCETHAQTGRKSGGRVSPRQSAHSALRTTSPGGRNSTGPTPRARQKHFVVSVCWGEINKRHSNRRARGMVPRAQLAFKNSMIHGILQFTLRIAFRCVLHRCESQDIHR